MIRTAIIEAGVVTNVVMLGPESGWMPPEGSILVASDIAAIGDAWDGGVFTPPALSTERINAAIYAKLAQIDARSVRPLRAILEAQAMGLAPDPADVACLASLRARADALRGDLVS